MRHRVVVGISGASGAAIGARVVGVLRELGADIDLVVSPAGEETLDLELGPAARTRLAAPPVTEHHVREVGAIIASGSVPTAGMIVAPCSMRTLSAIAHSLADNLLVRAADVHLKERRPLVLLTREAPFHLGHLRAMTAVTEMGAIVLPPVPAFYLKPRTIDEVIDQIARRAIDLVGFTSPTSARWSPQGSAVQASPVDAS